MTTDPQTASGETIELHKAYVFRHWIRQFDVSAQELNAAVQAVGPYEDKLRDYFGRQGARLAVSNLPAAQDEATFPRALQA